MKKMICFLFLVSFHLLIQAQQKDYDTTAIMILDRMSNVIGDLSSCKYTVITSSDRTDEEMGLTTRFARNEVYMVGPNKMLVNVLGDRGHREYWYNGSKLWYYSYDENNFARVDAPATIVETMDSINKAYGIDFPAADFFYPRFADDFLDNYDKIAYLGKSYIDGKECFHILGKNKEMTIQIWVANDATDLPAKMFIIYNGNKEISRYEASFSEWQINPDLPMAMFDFTPPPSATEVYLLPKNAK
jgi:hypothetical protein